MDPLIGVGGAPTRATTLPEDPHQRKEFPVASGVLDYFPDAFVALSYLSWKGNQQHNPGESLYWNRAKSGDESDTLIRHFLQRGTLDTDGVRHSVKMAWRALAFLQKELEAEAASPQSPDPPVPDTAPSSPSSEQFSSPSRGYLDQGKNPHIKSGSDGTFQLANLLIQSCRAFGKTP